MVRMLCTDPGGPARAVCVVSRPGCSTGLAARRTCAARELALSATTDLTIENTGRDDRREQVDDDLTDYDSYCTLIGCRLT
jgi:hypothetical protein